MGKMPWRQGGGAAVPLSAETAAGSLGTALPHRSHRYALACGRGEGLVPECRPAWQIAAADALAAQSGLFRACTAR